MTKKAKISWDENMNAWVLYFKNGDEEWLMDSGYLVKDVNPKSGLGWVSETIFTRARALKEMGFKVTIE